jgi:hypothetical protein
MSPCTKAKGLKRSNYDVCLCSIAVLSSKIELEGKHEVPRILTAGDVTECGS